MSSMFDFDDSHELAFQAKTAGKAIIAAKYEALNQTGDFLFLAHSDGEFAQRCEMIDEQLTNIAYRKLASISDSKLKLVKALHTEWSLRHAKCDSCSKESHRLANHQDGFDSCPNCGTMTARGVEGHDCDVCDCGHSLANHQSPDQWCNNCDCESGQPRIFVLKASKGSSKRLAGYDVSCRRCEGPVGDGKGDVCASCRTDENPEFTGPEEKTRHRIQEMFGNTREAYANSDRNFIKKTAELVDLGRLGRSYVGNCSCGSLVICERPDENNECHYFCNKCGTEGWVPTEEFNANTGNTREANKYIEKRGDQWVILQKGTGKVLSHHDSEEKAEASFRAMMQSKHGATKTARVVRVKINTPGGYDHDLFLCPNCSKDYRFALQEPSTNEHLKQGIHECQQCRAPFLPMPASPQGHIAGVGGFDACVGCGNSIASGEPCDTGINEQTGQPMNWCSDCVDNGNCGCGDCGSYDRCPNCGGPTYPDGSHYGQSGCPAGGVDDAVFSGQDTYSCPGCGDTFTYGQSVDDHLNNSPECTRAAGNEPASETELHDELHENWHRQHGDEPCTSVEDCDRKSRNYRD